MSGDHSVPTRWAARIVCPGRHTGLPRTGRKPGGEMAAVHVKLRNSRTERPWIAGFLCALLLPALGAWPAHAQGGTSAVCSLRIPANLTPGFSRTSSTGTYGTGGETGTITCSGTVDGHRVTGPGSFGFKGTYTGECFGNVGSGTYFFTVPTDVGQMHFTGTYTETRIGLTGPVEASQPGARFSGPLVVAPTKGDCVTAPVTEVLINIAGTFSS